MRELVEFLAKSLVDDPGGVEVREVSAEHAVVIEIRARPEDVGKLIGRQGRVIQAIRSLARAAALRRGKRVRVEVVRENG